MLDFSYILKNVICLWMVGKIDIFGIWNNVISHNDIKASTYNPCV